MFDLDGDGYVCAEDLKQVMKALGNDLTGRQRVQLVMPSIPGGFSDGWFRGRRVKRGWFFFLEGPSKHGHVAMGDWE